MNTNSNSEESDNVQQDLQGNAQNVVNNSSTTGTTQPQDLGNQSDLEGEQSVPQVNIISPSSDSSLPQDINNQQQGSSEVANAVQEPIINLGAQTENSLASLQQNNAETAILNQQSAQSTGDTNEQPAATSLSQILKENGDIPNGTSVKENSPVPPLNTTMDNNQPNLGQEATNSESLNQSTNLNNNEMNMKMGEARPENISNEVKPELPPLTSANTQVDSLDSNQSNSINSEVKKIETNPKGDFLATTLGIIVLGLTLGVIFIIVFFSFIITPREGTIFKNIRDIADSIF